MSSRSDVDIDRPETKSGNLSSYWQKLESSFLSSYYALIFRPQAKHLWGFRTQKIEKYLELSVYLFLWEISEFSFIFRNLIWVQAWVWTSGIKWNLNWGRRRFFKQQKLEILLSLDSLRKILSSAFASVKIFWEGVQTLLGTPLLHL